MLKSKNDRRETLCDTLDCLSPETVEGECDKFHLPLRCVLTLDCSCSCGGHLELRADKHHAWSLTGDDTHCRTSRFFADFSLLSFIALVNSSCVLKDEFCANQALATAARVCSLMVLT